MTLAEEHHLAGPVVRRAIEHDVPERGDASPPITWPPGKSPVYPDVAAWVEQVKMRTQPPAVEGAMDTDGLEVDLAAVLAELGQNDDLLMTNANVYWTGFIAGAQDGDSYHFYVVGQGSSGAVDVYSSSSSTRSRVRPLRTGRRASSCASFVCASSHSE